MEIRRHVDSGDAMTSRAIEIATDLTAEELRALARKESDRRAAMSMLAIAHELGGYERARGPRGVSAQSRKPRSKPPCSPAPTSTRMAFPPSRSRTSAG